MFFYTNCNHRQPQKITGGASLKMLYIKKGICKCFFRQAQNVILRVINLKRSVGVLWNPLLTGTCQVCS